MVAVMPDQAEEKKHPNTLTVSGDIHMCWTKTAIYSLRTIEAPDSGITWARTDLHHGAGQQDAIGLADGRVDEDPR